MGYERGQKTSLKSIHRPHLRRGVGRRGFHTEAASPGASPEIRLYLPHPQAQGWRHIARQAHPEEKSPSSPDSQDIQTRCRFSAEVRDSPQNRTDIPRLTPFQSVPLWWTWEVGAQPERTRTKKGRTSGQRGVW